MQRYFEIEALRRAGSRKMWVVIGLFGLTTAASLVIAIVAVIRPIPVVAFDKDGRAIVFTDTVSPALEMSKARVDWFVQHFLSKYIAIDSTRLDDDLTEALNLMTPELRDLVMADGSDIKRRKKYEGQNVRSSLQDLQVRIGDFDPKGRSPIYVVGWGKHVYEPIFGGTDKDKATRWLFFKMQLARYAVTRLSPHGLLVHYIDWQSYDSEPELTAQLLKVQRDAAVAGAPQ